VTLRSLRQLKLIDTNRSKIIVRDRGGIERLAQGFYGVPEKEYRLLIG